MTNEVASPAASTERAAEERRSTRLVRAIPVTIYAIDALGNSFREQTTTLELNCFGCTYRSVQYAPKDSVVIVEIWRAGDRSNPKTVRARVKRVRRPQNHRDYFKVALELETPGNVWGVSDPPADWFPDPDDVKPIVAEVPDAPEGGALRSFDLADSGIAGAISVAPESVPVNSEEVLVELEEPESIDLASEIQAKIESTLAALIERAARSATRDVMRYAALRAKAAIDRASKESEIVAEQIGAAIQEVLNSSPTRPKRAKRDAPRAPAAQGPQSNLSGATKPLVLDKPGGLKGSSQH